MALLWGTQTASASPTSAELDPPRWKHDVFLSFRGQDTRRGFVSHLDHELQYRQEMKTFKDDRDLEVGATISPELLTAIEQSHLAIIVLSPNYASSTWSLDELSKILECMEDTKRILPIFYHVDPSDVRNQRGSFAEALTKHEERFSDDVEKLNRWRAALRKVANLTGLDSKTYKSEAKLIEDIVKRVLKKVHPTFTLLDSEEKLVGIDFALEQLRLQLDLEVNDVLFIGIWGMGGLGKTTLAKLVFQRISHHFEHRRFLSNVREVSAKHGGLIDLQRQILFPILKKHASQAWDEGAGTFFTRNRLCNQKVLLILDDVDQSNQLITLAGKKDWFGVGSRIIITTRNERLLVQHGITRRYKVKVLNNGQALELFSQHAFKKHQPEEGFLELSQRFLHYAKGLPLAVKTLGSFLYARDQDAWNSMLHNLDKIPNPTVFHSLKVSYDGLEEMEKKFFLHVACFHKGKDKEQVIEILDSIWDISNRIGMYILIEKSLLTIEKNYFRSDTIEMHDLIQEMAWEIVRQECVEEPGRRSCLWHPNDISLVFMNNTGTCAIEAIVLHLPKLEVVHWNCTKAFSKMHKLRLLEFDNVIFSSGPKDLPNSLRIIRWSWYPSKSLPPRFHPRFLVKLEMPHSKLIRLWDGAKDFPKLKYIDLSYSDKLSSTPDFTCVPILKELKLKSCTNLVDVHASIAVLKRLKHLDLSDCKSIKSLPSKVEMDSLEYFSLSGCSKVKKLPEFEGHMKNLFKLILKGTAVEQIPSSIEGLVGLAVQGKNNCESLLGQILYMQISSKHVKLPGEMECLEELELSGTAMRELLAVMTNRKYVSLRGSVAKSSTSTLWALFGFRKSLDPKPDPWGLVLPSLYRLRSLTEINLIGSNNFEELFPDNISCLSSLNHITSYQCRLMSLTELNLSDCNIFEGVIPDDIGNFSSLERLILSGNNFVSLPASIRFLYKLCSLDLGRCERLAQLPDLPSKRSKRSLLLVNVSDCTSLKRLSDPSKLSEEANVYDFMFSCLNCFRLVEDEGWINRIFSRIMKLAVEGIYPVFDHCTFIVCPGSEIPDWFNNRSVGDSITVELPLPPQPCSNWIGIASCVVFADSEYLENPASVVGYDHFRIECLRGPSESFEVGHLGSQHLWVFYLPRDHPSLMDASSSHQFSFEAFYDSNRASLNRLKTSSIIKKCGARLVYKRDLEEFSQRLKIGSLEEFSQRLKIGSGSSDDDDFNEFSGKR
ncbi:TMV resistance protein N-like isoform X2 [Prunus avium]|uniref:ADP-ribosyl cyclase/cyclic ADP-ribose hydrolase n=1 Tax=Prunus avium TaxID=42229 RepID=A0A6P5SAU1_PRUAV|nr:TMV resistance protein N-like isoform X2 [Prunus avium]